VEKRSSELALMLSTMGFYERGFVVMRGELSSRCRPDDVEELPLSIPESSIRQAFSLNRDDIRRQAEFQFSAGSSH
jgi:hypothetical protein